MAESVLRAKIGFFDTNPLGRILNRFSADVGITDDLLPTTWFDFLVVAFIVLGSIVTTLTTLPFALAVLPPLSLYFWRVRSVFVTSTRELKRLEGLARSPIFAMLGESLGGIATIRSNNFLDYFRLKFREAHDAHTKAFFAFISASRWVGFRMDSLVYSFLVIVSYLSLFVQQKQWFDIDPAILGLSISFLLYLAGLFQWCIRQSAEVVNQSTLIFCFVLERILLPFAHVIIFILSSGLRRTHSCLWLART
jgi:ATP-binding cassette, subfamily C (CFTR/MRP), member 4